MKSKEIWCTGYNEQNMSLDWLLDVEMEVFVQEPAASWASEEYCHGEHGALAFNMLLPRHPFWWN